MAIGVSAANSILNGLCGRLDSVTLAPSSYLGFLTGVPTLGGNSLVYNEPNEQHGYARILIGSSSGGTSLMEPASGGRIKNNKQIAGTECIGQDWAPISCFGIFSTGTVGQGNLLAWGYLQDANGDRATYNVTVGKIPVFRVDALQLSFELTEPVSQGA